MYVVMSLAIFKARATSNAIWDTQDSYRVFTASDQSHHEMCDTYDECELHLYTSK